MQRPCADLQEAPEPIAERVLQSIAKRALRQHGDMLGLPRRQRPYDADTSPGKRQHRERAADDEALVCDAIVWLVGRDVDDQRLLRVPVLAGADAERLAHPGPCA